MATTVTTPTDLTIEHRPATRHRLVALALIASAALPVLAGKLGLISDYTFLQLSLMIVYSIAVLGLSLLTGYNGQI